MLDVLQPVAGKTRTLSSYPKPQLGPLPCHCPQIMADPEGSPTPPRKSGILKSPSKSSPPTGHGHHLEGHLQRI